VPAETTFSMKSLTVYAVYKNLKAINERKVAGLDKIPCKLLRIAAEIVVPSLIQILNKAYKKLTRVTPIFKKGKKDDMNNYRPISVISVVAKIFEKFTFKQLYEHLNNNNLIYASQSGFRSLHSRRAALIEATDNWSINIDKGLLNEVIFIDLKKHLILLITPFFYGSYEFMALMKMVSNSSNHT
jgi:hypothetical protein